LPIASLLIASGGIQTKRSEADRFDGRHLQRSSQVQHPQRAKGRTRFAKGTSETFSVDLDHQFGLSSSSCFVFQTLKNLELKGVKVELGIPRELWDDPPAEVTELKRQCENLVERHEADIEEWYGSHQEKILLIDFLCRDRVLKKKDSECLYEILKPKSEDAKSKQEL
jgi:hypothetical protein